MARGRGWLRRHWNQLTPRGKKVFGGVIGGLFLLFIGLIGVVYAAATVPLPSELDTAQATVIEYSDGSTLGQIAKENRTDIPLADVPEHVKWAVLAAEDRGYYKHSGISLSGIVRAAYHDVRGGGAKQGGSTITQQYARNAFLTQHRTFARKFREAVIAVKLDRKYSKDQVLEWYLNTIYFGRGAYGIEAAAQTYFGVPAKRLTVEQGAVLAALIRSPEGGDPAIAPNTAKRRWNNVLDAMVETKHLDKADRDRMQYPKIRDRKAAGGKTAIGGPTGYVVEAVRQELKKNGFTDDEIYTGGLRVRTTIDRRRQDAAVKAVQGILDDPRKDPPAALVAVEPGTGKIVAMYGGRDYGAKDNDKSFINYAYNARQPGSSFKPFVLAAALDDGVSLKSTYDGHSPQTFANYEVENFGNEQFGRIDLVTATAHSVNTVYVPLGMKVGLDKTIDVMHRMGVDSTDCKDHRDATLYLGTCDIEPVEEATAYATFAANGKQADAHLVTEVRDRKGHKAYTAKTDTHEAISEGEAADAIHAMRAVVTEGTGRAAAIGRPVAGKTGTTSDNTNAWFSGFAPQLAATVWMGYEPVPGTGIPPLRNLHGYGEVTGGTLPAKIWHDFMAAAMEGVPVQDFPPPVFGGKAVNPSPSGTPSATPSATPTPSVTVTVPPTTVPPSTVPTLFSPTPSESPKGTGSPQPTPTASASPTAAASNEPPP